MHMTELLSFEPRLTPRRIRCRGKCEFAYFPLISSFLTYSFSALTLLVGWQEGHPACKKLSGGVLAWLSVWGEVQISIWPS